jgi:hypothetical protein
LDNQIALLLALIEQGKEARSARNAAGLNSDLLTEQLQLGRETIIELKRLRSALEQRRTA